MIGLIILKIQDEQNEIKGLVILKIQDEQNEIKG